MSSVLPIPRVWDLLDRFKDWCHSKGWKTSGHEDWVKADDKFHNFVWIRTVYPSTFEKVAARHKCVVRKDVSYEVVDVSYTAWVFPQTPPENLIKKVAKNSELSRRTAIYDLSWAYAGKSVCLKLNETDSIVFREFERFLVEKCGVKVKPARILSSRRSSKSSIASTFV